MGSEDAILEGLGRHPAYRQQALPAFPVVVCLVDVSCHTKIWRKDVHLAGPGLGAAAKGPWLTQHRALVLSPYSR